MATRMGSEFVPSLSEGDFALQALRVPGTSLSQSVDMQQRLERRSLLRSPGGRADVCPNRHCGDCLGPHAAEHFGRVRDAQARWPNGPNLGKTRDELHRGDAGSHRASVPGNNYELSQPIQLRFNELISGVRSDVAVKIFGDDMDVLNKSAEEVSAMLQKIQGSSEVKVEQTTGLPMLTVNIDRQKAARYGLNVADIQDTVATAIGGREAGTMFEGDRRFDILVRLPETLRNDLEGMKRLPIPLPRSADGTEAKSNFIPLVEVATFELAPGPNQVSRENGKRRMVVSTNVRGRDVGSFVARG